MVFAYVNSSAHRVINGKVVQWWVGISKVLFGQLGEGLSHAPCNSKFEFWRSIFLKKSAKFWWFFAVVGNFLRISPINQTQLIFRQFLPIFPIFLHAVFLYRWSLKHEILRNVTKFCRFFLKFSSMLPTTKPLHSRKLNYRWQERP